MRSWVGLCGPSREAVGPSPLRVFGFGFWFWCWFVCSVGSFCFSSPLLSPPLAIIVNFDPGHLAHLMATPRTPLIVSIALGSVSVEHAFRTFCVLCILAPSRRLASSVFFRDDYRDFQATRALSLLSQRTCAWSLMSGVPPAAMAYGSASPCPLRVARDTRNEAFKVL